MSDDTRTIPRSVRATGLVLTRVAFFLLLYSGILFAKNVYMKETLTLNKCNVRKIAIVGEFTFSFIHPGLRKSCAGTRGKVDIRHRPLLCTGTFSLLLLVLSVFSQIYLSKMYLSNVYKGTSHQPSPVYENLHFPTVCINPRSSFRRLLNRREENVQCSR